MMCYSVKSGSSHLKKTTPHSMGVTKCGFGLANLNFVRSARNIFGYTKSKLLSPPLNACIYTYARTQTRTYTYMSWTPIYTHAPIHIASMSIHIYKQKYACMGTYMHCIYHMNTHINTHTHTRRQRQGHIHYHMYASTHTFAHTHTHRYTHIHAYMHACMYTGMRVCVIYTTKICVFFVSLFQYVIGSWSLKWKWKLSNYQIDYFNLCKIIL